MSRIIWRIAQIMCKVVVNFGVIMNLRGLRNEYTKAVNDIAPNQHCISVMLEIGQRMEKLIFIIIIIYKRDLSNHFSVHVDAWVVSGLNILKSVVISSGYSSQISLIYSMTVDSLRKSYYYYFMFNFLSGSYHAKENLNTLSRTVPKSFL